MIGSDVKVAGLLLAAGGSSRLGRPKQLLELEGKTLIRRAAETLIETGCDPIVVVLGAEVADSKNALGRLGVNLVINDGWESGMGSSIAVGITSLLETDILCDAVLITLCDQPHVNCEHLTEFVCLFSESRPSVIAAKYNGIAGVPTLFSKEMFPPLQRLTGDKGARELIRNSPDAVTIPLPEAAIDIDTVSDSESLVNHQ